ncbi:MULTISPECIES: ABC transporter permease [Vagococcus]|uniref:ABC transporter permease protein n=1 Tax=Vagococcus fluvialis bH819 TaxID=1255619 RepID=A0A1X6WLE6_9ENTE|nr:MULTISPECIES: ABC transporter permease [Vagococcus]SLM85062.1 ABC transporter permease protein [Vagococcus fluvialis bH819]HCM88522.1 ABC transporter permease [Vagococcus sp.]
MKALIKIEAKRMTRDKTTFIMSIGMPIFMYFIFTSLIQVPKDYQAVFYREYLISMTAFSLCSFSLFTFPFDIIQDRKNGWSMRLKHVNLSSFEIYFVKMLKMIVMYIVAITSVFLVGGYFKGVELTAKQWLVSGLVLLLGGVLFLGIGIVMSLFKEIKTASVFSNILYLGMAALGGLWMPTSQFPEWIQPYSKAMPTYQFRELAVGYINNGRVPINSIIILTSYSLGFILLAVVISNKMKRDMRE